MKKRHLKPSDTARWAEEPNTEGLINSTTRVGPSLYLQRRDNNKSWLMRWAVNRKTRWMGLGSYGDVTQARAEALR
jgi:hypothetical protein